MSSLVSDAGQIPVRKNLSKNAAVMLCSVALAGIGVFNAQRYIENQIEHYRKQMDKTEEMTQIVVPRRSLERGDVIVAETLSVRDIPSRYADSNSITANEYESALGQRLSYAVDQGRPLLWAHLEGGLVPTFSGKVPTGLRAITVRVDEINSISGFLQPNDKIDLLFSYTQQNDNRIYPLIQNLDVFATGIQTQIDKTSLGGQRDFTTITLKVTPEQAKLITLSQQAGKLTAMLRNPDDDLPLSESTLSLAQLLKNPKAKQRSVASKPSVYQTRHQVEYIIGGS